MNTALFVYHDSDLNMLETCLSSLIKVSDCRILVFTDTDIPADLMARLSSVTFVVDDKSMLGRRALYKVEVYTSYAIENPEDDVLVSDIDVIFLKDPFEVFNTGEWLIGLTSRGYECHFPINAGIIYIRSSLSKVKEGFLNWHRLECSGPVWFPYVEWRKTFNHVRFGFDWTVGQDFLNVCWVNRKSLPFPVKINDVTCRYNYCPARDLLGEKGAEEAIKYAYKHRTHSTLHLKSSLKRLIYEDLFIESIINYPKQEEFIWRNLK